MTGPFKRFLREVRETRRRRRDKTSVDVTADGFIYTSRGNPVTIGWDTVTRLWAGTFAISSGEMFFVRVAAGASEVQVDEFADGFSAFERAVGERYAGAREKMHALQASISRHDRLVELWSAG